MTKARQRSNSPSFLKKRDNLTKMKDSNYQQGDVQTEGYGQNHGYAGISDGGREKKIGARG